MFTATVRAAFGLTAVLAAAPAQTTAEYLPEYVEADRRTVRLAPSAFPQLPEAVRTELERRRCTVPQVYSDNKPHNFIQGQFFRPGQTDWAVLCSVRRMSTILVFPNGGADRVMELARRKDVDMMQGVGPGQIGYSWAIFRATPANIRRHDYDRVAGRIDHDGIDDAFIEKGSVVWYFRRGKWERLRGSD